MSIGFSSIVQKPGDDDLMIRARSRAGLDRFRDAYLPELGEMRAIDPPACCVRSRLRA